MRSGLEKVLANVVADVSLQGFGYTDLERQPDPAFSPDLLLLSIASHERLGSLVAASIRAFSPKRIVLMAEGLPAPGSFDALPPLVVGYINKSSEPEVFVNAVRRVLGGHTCFPWPILERKGVAAAQGYFVTDIGATHQVSTPGPELRHPVDHAVLPFQPLATPSSPLTSPSGQGASGEADLLGLTPRQYTVLLMLSRGLSLKEVARALNISLGTTKAHTEAVYQRLGAHNRNEAVYIARHKGALLRQQPEPPDENKSYA